MKGPNCLMFVKSSPLQTLLSFAYKGEAALYLSAGASWMTGNTMTIDGGELIRIAGELPIEEG